MRPSACEPKRTGKVTSARSVASLSSRAPVSSTAFFASSASETLVFKELTVWPKALRSSAGRPPSLLISSETRPFLPSAETRTTSSAAKSFAAAISATIWASRVVRSVVVVMGNTPLA